MRICIVVNTFPNVSETFIINKVIALAAHGHKVSVACFKEHEEKDIFSAYELRNKNISVHVIGLSKSVPSIIGSCLQNPGLFFRSLSLNIKKMRKNYEHNYYLYFFKKIKYDIIHFEFSGLGVTFLPIIPKLKGKKVVSCRGTAEKVKLTLHADRKDGLTQLFQRVDMIHCVSDDMKNTVLPYCRDTSKIFVNRPAIDPEYFKPELIREEGDANTVKILTIIRLAFVKGVLIGLLAVRTLVRKGIPVHWNIIGDGPQKEEIMFHIHYLGLEKHVSLLGRKPKEAVNDALNRTDIFMLTSYSEGIPNVVLEAMSKEKPVVSTRCGGVEEVIDHGIDGFIAEMYDHDAVATYVERLALDKPLRQQIGAEARKKVLAEYTLSRQVKVFEENYHLLLAE